MFDIHVYNFLILKTLFIYNGTTYNVDQLLHSSISGESPVHESQLFQFYQQALFQKKYFATICSPINSNHQEASTIAPVVNVIWLAIFSSCIEGKSSEICMCIACQIS